MSASLDATPTAGLVSAVDASAPWSVTLAKPTALVENEYLFAVASIDTTGSTTVTLTPPSGFDLVQSAVTTGSGQPAIAVYRKKATASEPNDYTFTGTLDSGTAQNAFVVMLRCQNADLAAFLDAIGASVSGGSSVSPSSPAITTSVPNALIVSAVATSDGRHVASQDANGPSGFTTHHLRASSSSSSGTTIGIASKPEPAAGTYGPFVWTGALTTANTWRGITLAIRPGAGLVGRPSYAYAQMQRRH